LVQVAGARAAKLSYARCPSERGGDGPLVDPARLSKVVLRRGLALCQSHPAVGAFPARAFQAGPERSAKKRCTSGKVTLHQLEEFLSRAPSVKIRPRLCLRRRMRGGPGHFVRHLRPYLRPRRGHSPLQFKFGRSVRNSRFSFRGFVRPRGWQGQRAFRSSATSMGALTEDLAPRRLAQRHIDAIARAALRELGRRRRTGFAPGRAIWTATPSRDPIVTLPRLVGRA